MTVPRSFWDVDSSGQVGTLVDRIRSRLGSRWHTGYDHRIKFPAPDIRPGWFYVYLAWGLDRSRPVYVGKTNHAIERIGTHYAHAAWIPEVVEFECYAFGTEREALNAEGLAIHQLNPIHNKNRSNVGPRSPHRPYPKGRGKRVWLTRFDGIDAEQLEIIGRIQNNRGRV